MTRRSLAFVLVAMMLSALAAAQPYAPIVTMVVTMPDGRTQELTAAESGLATLTLKDGTEYGFRPTIQDSAPWNRIVVTVFKSATNSAPTTVLGEIELRRGGRTVNAIGPFELSEYLGLAVIYAALVVTAPFLAAGRKVVRAA